MRGSSEPPGNSLSRSCNSPVSVNAQILVVILLVFGAIAVIISFLASNSIITVTEDVSLCDTQSPTEQDIYACYTAQCSFDISLCPEKCPFGFMKDERGCENECTCASTGIFEGDIMFDENELPEMIKQYGFSSEDDDFAIFVGSATSRDSRLWKDDFVEGKYRIKYTVATDVEDEARDYIKQAIARYHKDTCIRFEEVPLGYEKMHIAFKASRYCSSPVGRRYYDENTPVTTQKYCTTTLMQHELLHTLGFNHEQSRPDRDAYVEIVEENIKEYFKWNFRKEKRRSVRDLNSEYDLTSILHYKAYAFTKNWKKTIVSRSGAPLGRGNDLTEKDLYELRTLYNCPNDLNPVIKWSQWNSWSTCDVTCGKGQKSRYRGCFTGSATVATGCKGSNVDTAECTLSPCSGVWGNWGSFGPCSRTCGHGYRWRIRRCDSNQNCYGSRYEVQSCNRQSCRRAAMWSSWSNWSQCRATCGKSIATRMRFCRDNNGKTVKTCGNGKSSNHGQLKQCDLPSCESLIKNWGSWSQCSATCDGYRKRVCSGQACTTNEEVENCATRPCKEPDIFTKTKRNLNIDHVCNAAFTVDNWVFGDFNGDSRMDVVCTDMYGVYQLSYGTESGFNSVWSGSFENCIDGSLFEADINGDEKGDLICNSKDEGKLYVKYSSDSRLLDDVTDGGDFCTQYTSKLSPILNFKPIGLLCQFSNNRVEIKFARK